MYIYVQLGHFTVRQKLVRHCKSTILQFKKNILKRKAKYGLLKTILAAPLTNPGQTHQVDLPSASALSLSSYHYYHRMVNP